VELNVFKQKPSDRYRVNWVTSLLRVIEKLCMRCKRGNWALG